MELDAFNKLSDREKWDNCSTLKDVVWCCKFCGDIISNSPPKRLPGFPGLTEYCGECDNVLTRRTGGGMSDPFNYKAVAK